MASIKMEFVAGATYTYTKTVSAAHMTRLVVAYRAIYGQVSDGNGGMRDRTDAEVVQAIADGLFAGLRENVRNQEKYAAARTAGEAVADITLT